MLRVMKKSKSTVPSSKPSGLYSRIRRLGKRAILEKNVERATVQRASTLGFLSLKLNVLAFVGWPDRMFVTPAGYVFFVEFKRPGGTCTPIQEHMHAMLRERHQTVLVIDNIEDGCAAMDVAMFVERTKLHRDPG